MLLELQPPYANDWRKGYLQAAKDGRKYVVLFNSNADRTVTAYARYLLGVKLGRYLTADEEADHKDDDRTNDDLDNLQVLAGEANRAKQAAHRKAVRLPKHGTLTEYRYCKCELCKKAKADHNKKAKQQRTPG